MNPKPTVSLPESHYWFLVVLLTIGFLTGCLPSTPSEETNTPTCFNLRWKTSTSPAWGIPFSPLESYANHIVFSGLQEEEMLLVVIDLEAPERTQVIQAQRWPPFLTPTIYSDRLAWLEESSTVSHIYVYDLKTEEKELITPSGVAVGVPALYEEHLVWPVWPAGERCIDEEECLLQLKHRNLSTGTEEELDISAQQLRGRLYLWDAYLVYTARGEAGDLDIVLHDLTTGEEGWLVTGEGDQKALDLQGTQLLYSPGEDGSSLDHILCNRGGTESVYGSSLGEVRYLGWI